MCCYHGNGNHIDGMCMYIRANLRYKVGGQGRVAWKKKVRNQRLGLLNSFKLGIVQH